jgi:hypothetical protein
MVVGYFHFETAGERDILGCEMKEVSGRPDPKHVEYVIRGTPELDGSRYDAPLHSPVEWFQPEDGEPRGCHGPQLFRLQLHQDSSYTSHIASDGGWRHRSAVERRRFSGPLGSLRTAEGGKSGVNAGMVILSGA